ncbi:Ig-like domain-containing protein [Agrococcus jejuensis]|uniref:LPXTG-motif cell wall anchor domain-containing protein n=1 Tax=Agrococcus jejuensis TaxID=399736 RepID=A0A1G8E2F8_9MICO|nr:Ig-like domain-containing protein [Agrococcus jejuensis]SDH63910.1 LPXTG-motif cell wall anchor domain-containing protein [Agrococcus jejuensis]
MSHTGVNRTPIGIPQRLKRVLAGAVSSMLVAGGLVAISVAAPIVQAPDANAAPNFLCGPGATPTLYATGNPATNTANPRDIFQINPATGATSVAYAPGIATGTLNQLAISRDGAKIFWTNGATATSNIYEYTPGNTPAGAGVLDTPTPRGTAAAAGNTMGGYDLATDRFVFGAATFTAGAANAPLVVHSYNPTGNGVAANVATINLPSPAGGNGDLAFSPAGTMYVVSGGNTQQTPAGSGGLDEAQLYRVTGGISTTTTTGTTHTATALGGRIEGVRGLNSIAFGADGYLYLFGTDVSVTPNTAALIKVNPSNGDIVSRTTLTGPAAGGLTDLASCASPSTVRGDVELDEPRQGNDQFQVVIGGGGLNPADTSTQGTTTGSGGAVDNTGPVTGPVIVLPGDTVTVTQTTTPGSTTPTTDYAATWQCIDTAYGDALVSSGFGHQASFTMPTKPAIGSNVICTFTNEEAVSSITLDKTAVTTTANAIGDTLSYTFTITNTGNVPASNVTLSDPSLSNVSCTFPVTSGFLNPGQVANCTGSRAAVRADFQGTGPISNTATASATTQQTPAGGQPFTSTDTATITPNRAAPTPQADTSSNNTIGSPVTVNVIGNDGTVVAGSVRLVDGTGALVTTLPVTGGTYTANANGTITFTPNQGFTGNPPAVTYSVEAPNGIAAQTTLTITYAPAAQPDVSNGNPLGQPVVVPVLANDSGTVAPGTLQLFDPAANGGAGGYTSGPVVIPGQGTWTIETRPVGGTPTTVVVFTPNAGYLGNPTPITYQVGSGQPGDAPTSTTVTVRYAPEANPDAQDGYTAGQPATINPLANDRGTFDPNSFAFIPPGSTTPLAPGAALVVEDEGTWTYDPAAGVVTFTPLPTFFGDPTPVGYQIVGAGGSAQSTITLEVLPLARPDENLGNTIGDTVTVQPLANDSGTFDPTNAFAFLTGEGGTSLGTTYSAPGEGTWEYAVVGGVGTVTFTPNAGFLVDPTPIWYRVTDDDGDTAESTITITYVPEAVDDLGDITDFGDVATVDVLDNDTGDFDQSTLAFIPSGSTTPIAPLAPLTVTGEGVWAWVETAPGSGEYVVTFTPDGGFEGDPTPIGYQVTDVTGDTVDALITIPYQVIAVDDTIADQTIGQPVAVPVLANDRGTIDPGSIQLFDPAANGGAGGYVAPGTPVTIPGQGVWTVETRDLGAGPVPVVVFTPFPLYQGDPDPMQYQVTSPNGATDQGLITITVIPVAQPDSVLLAPLTDPGTPVTVPNILGNDAGVLDPESVEVYDVANDVWVGVGGTVTVPGQGTWQIVLVPGTGGAPATVDVIFTAEPGFFGDPTPVQYRAEDGSGDLTAPVLITVTFQPVANPDSDGAFVIGQPATIQPLLNDLGDLVPATFTFIDAAGNPLGTTLTVPGQGVWTYDPATATVTFTPESGYEGDPSFVRYQISDTKGATAQSTIRVDYDSVGADDISDNNPVGTTVTLVNVLADDGGIFDPATFTFNPIPGSTLNPDGSLTVPGEGTWTFVLTPGGDVNVTFTPLPTFQSDPSIVTYTAGPGPGQTGSTTAQLIIDYVQLGTPDAVLLAPLTEPGTPVLVADVLGNDLGAIDPATFALVPPAGVTPGADGSITVPGEGTWTFVIVPGEGDELGTVDVTFTAAPGFQGDPTPIGYTANDVAGDPIDSTIRVTFQPVANPDAQGDFVLNENATIAPLANDLGDFVAASFTFLDADGNPVAGPVTVPGQGVWSFVVDGDVVTVTFDPADGFLGDPDPIGYAITDQKGVTVESTITFDYDPVAASDSVSGIEPGTPATVPNVLGNDSGVFDETTFAFVPAEGLELEADGSYVVPGEGTWSFVITPGEDGAPATVDVIFTPEEGFLSDPTPVDYVVEDLSGTETGATITVDYLQTAAPDQVLLAPLTEPGTPVDVEDVLGNDVGDFDLGTFALIHPETGALFGAGEPMLVDGEGTWTFEIVPGEGDAPDTVTVTFTALPGYEGDPTEIGYQVADIGGDVVDSTILVTFQPVANDDSESGFAIGTNAQVSPLTNDLGEFDVTTFTFVPPAGLELNEDGSLTIPGEGTWSYVIDIAAGTVLVVFDPEDGFEGDPSPVDYEITSESDITVGATITVDYQPLAVDDTVAGLEPGTVATLDDVLANDAGDLDPTTFAFVPGAEGGVLDGGDLVVDGQGTWSFTIDVETGVVTVTFTPEEGFLSDPTPVSYTVEDRSGSETGALLTVDYLQAAADDANLDQPITEPVTVADILANDAGDFLPESVQLFDPATESWLEPGAELVVPGEGVWTIVVNDDGTVDVVFTPEEGYLGDPTPVQYQAADAGGDLAQATITVSYLPVANDDEDLANEYGVPVPVDVLANDVGDFDPATVSLYDPAANGGEGAWLEAGESLVVAGQGTWSIDPATGIVTFTPEAGYGGDPDVVTYRVTDSTGDTVEATITVTYGPTAVDDESLRNAQGMAVTVDVLANDLGQFDPTSVRIVDGEELVTELVVAGEGTWRVDPETGAITFTPASGFTGNPTPIAYQVTDVTGDVDQATVTITYLPQAFDDRSEGNAPGTAVTVDPLANDAGDLDPTTVEIRDPQTGDWGKTVVVPGEGTWTVDPVTGAITFTPERGFTGDPTPITYRVTDVNGESTQATVTIDYRQAPIPGLPDLPRTGAEITLWSLIAGFGLLLAGAAVWLIRRRRQDVTDA